MSDREEISAKLQCIVEELFDILGITSEEYNIGDYEARGVAPCHDGANNPTSFCYYFDSGLWMCYSEECHKEYGADLVGLISACKRCSVQESLEFAENLLSGKTIDFNSINYKRVARHIAKPDLWKEHHVQEFYEPAILNKLSSPDPYAKKRGLSVELVKSMGGGIASAGSLHHRFVLPIYNIASNIVGFTGRTLDDNLCVPKWLHAPRHLKKGLNLFNIQNAFEAAQKSKTMIVVEGPIDAIKMMMAGYYNVVALLGTSISDGQITLLSRCNVCKVFLAMDNDKAGNKSTFAIAMKLNRALFDHETLQPPDNKKDWGECEPQDIKNAINGII